MQKDFFYFLNFKWYFAISVLMQRVLQTLFHPSNVGDPLQTTHITFLEILHSCDRTNFSIAWVLVYVF